MKIYNILLEFLIYSSLLSLLAGIAKCAHERRKKINIINIDNIRIYGNLLSTIKILFKSLRNNKRYKL